MTIRRALFSVYDKTGLAAFARELSGLGVELLASSGSAKLLADERIPVTPLEDVTGFGDLLGHRVVTLHPAVHGGILARRDLPEDMAELRAHDIAPIDLVCVNLYPFERTVGRLDVAWEDAIEQIDVGGPALLRAAAKNHAHVVPVCRPEDYEPVVEELRAARRDHGRHPAHARGARVPAHRRLRRRGRRLAGPRRLVPGDRSSPSSSATWTSRTARTRTSGAPTTRRRARGRISSRGSSSSRAGRSRSTTSAISPPPGSWRSSWTAPRP